MPNNFQRHMSDFDKGHIIAFRKQNLSLSQIAKEINRPNSTKQTFLDRYETFVSIEKIEVVTSTKTLLLLADLN